MVPLPRRKRRGLASRTIVRSESQVDVGTLATKVEVQVSRASVAAYGRRQMRVLSPDAAQAAPQAADDDPGPQRRLYSADVRDVILDRFLVRSVLGTGSYGTVVRAEDKYTGTLVAVKVFHKDEDANYDAAKEVRLYHKLLAGCNRHTGLFAAVVGAGMHRGYDCIVFEVCQGTLCDVISGRYDLNPLPARHVLEMAYQLVKGIEYLHSLGIVHADIKPDNIALRSCNTVTVSWLDPLTGFRKKEVLVSSEICILDLGLAIDTSDKAQTGKGRIGNRAYRAPEISFGLPWSYGVDCFAIGCVVSELYMARDLFPSSVSSELEHLAMIEKIVGPFPEKYARYVSLRCPNAFTVEPIAICFPPAGASAAGDHMDPMMRIEQACPLSCSILDITLHDLLWNLMHPDPSKRMTLEAASKHKYFDRLSRLELQ